MSRGPRSLKVLGISPEGPWLMVQMRRFMIVGALQCIGSRCHRLEMLTKFLFVCSQTIILAHIDGSKRVKRSESEFKKCRSILKIYFLNIYSRFRQHSEPHLRAYRSSSLHTLDCCYSHISNGSQTIRLYLPQVAKGAITQSCI